MATAEHDSLASLDLPPDLEGQLEFFKKRVWRVKIAEGLLAAAFGLLLSYLVVFTLDRFFDTPGWMRLVILIGGSLGLGLFFPLKLHRWVWQRRSLEQVARLLRVTFPGLGDELLGIVELAKRGGDGAASATLVQAAMKQADERVRMEDFSNAVPEAKTRPWILAAAIVGAMALLALIFVPRAGWNAVVRWVLPLSETERYTFAQVDGLPEQLVVPLAEPFEVAANLAPNTEWSPETGRVQIGKRPAVEAGLSEEGAYAFSLPAQASEERMKVRIGDKRAHIPVIPMARPELTGLVADVKLPDYLGYASNERLSIQGGSVPIVLGSLATLEATASRELAEATIDGESLTLSEDRATMRSKPFAIDSGRSHEISWRDQHGLTPKQPLGIEVEAVEDGSPAIGARQTTPDQVVLASEVVKFSVDAADDFGVKEIGLEWEGIPDSLHNPTPAKGDKIVAAGGNEIRTVEQEATFSAARETVSPQTLRIRAYTIDYLPERERIYSPEFTLHVLSPEDHAQWITREFGQWFRQAQEVYEREQQLHAMNEDLRDLAPAELDRPENRRKIEKQAAAERANGKRLSSLTQSGSELVAKATKNEEFDAERLETWATLLQQLDKIAKEDMPSVADLLKKTSEAAGKVGEDRNQKPGGGSAKPPGAPTKPTPSIVDAESNSMPAVPKPDEETESEEEKSADEKPKVGKFGLPTTQLAAVPGEKKPDEKKPESPAQQKLEEAVDDQENLLAEFEKIRDQMSDLLSSLEASTFVKRFKAASRKQMDVASDINRTILSGFGLAEAEVKEAKQKRAANISKRLDAESDTVAIIQEDLDAYFTRKRDNRYKLILDEMRETAVVSELEDISRTVKVNLNGRSIVAAEFWSDTLDRWAEQLVGATNCSSCSGGSGDSLPPQVVLKVIKLLHEEMALRDETRELESAKSALEIDQFGDRANSLSRTQVILDAQMADVIDEIRDLENGAKRFEKEIQLLSAAGAIMEEASNILATPDTGPAAVAAETEVIELLLQAKRKKPGSSGGGGSGGTPGNGGEGTTNRAALANFGPGEDGKAAIEDRNIDQSTGTTGRELPEEFRAGLDAYFNRLEGGSL